MIEDTIAAIATPLGEGGIGIVRLSGPKAVEIAREIFRPRTPKDLTKVPNFTLHLGEILDVNGKVIDEVLLSIMRGPRSYTAEDVIEINCHGGPYVLREVLRTVLAKGARLAEPGEFTRRAFLNGRIDLVQAEAVIEIIRAKSRTGLKAALDQLGGELSKEIERLGQALLAVMAQVEASIDFPEEVDFSGSEIFNSVKKALGGVEALLAKWDEGRLIREGLRLAIVGRPNVGKSSLLNALLQEERAIVSDIPGTTRDTIEEILRIGGIMCRVVDTAGLRETEDSLERVGVERTKREIARADLLLIVIDVAAGVQEGDRDIIDGVGDKPAVIVANKVDLIEKIPYKEVEDFAGGRPWVAISAQNGRGIDELRKKIGEVAMNSQPLPKEDELILLRERHRDALERCRGHLLDFIKGWEENIPLDLVAIDLRAAWQALGEITGQTTTEDLLDKIFSDFCIGK
ncbi:MAG: tRNA modification GTPase [Clostridia bacterium]|nr:tRNA modification GTPase [Clostridia bacterium]